MKILQILPRLLLALTMAGLLAVAPIPGLSSASASTGAVARVQDWSQSLGTSELASYFETRAARVLVVEIGDEAQAVAKALAQTLKKAKVAKSVDRQTATQRGKSMVESSDEEVIGELDLGATDLVVLVRTSDAGESAIVSVYDANGELVTGFTWSRSESLESDHARSGDTLAGAGEDAMGVVRDLGADIEERVEQYDKDRLSISIIGSRLRGYKGPSRTEVPIEKFLTTTISRPDLYTEYQTVRKARRRRVAGGFAILVGGPLVTMAGGAAITVGVMMRTDLNPGVFGLTTLLLSMSMVVPGLILIVRGKRINVTPDMKQVKKEIDAHNSALREELGLEPDDVKKTGSGWGAALTPAPALELRLAFGNGVRLEGRF